MNALLQVGIGLVYGYAVATTTEMLIHRHVHHAGPRLRLLCRRYPRLLRALVLARFVHHVIHHCHTYRLDHVTQFESAGEEAAVAARFEGERLRYARLSRYGLVLMPMGVVRFLVAAILASVPAACLFGRWALVGCAPVLVAPPLLSTIVHPWLHETSDRRRARPERLLRWWLGTRYMTMVLMHHYVHHKRPTVNYNLLLGADYVFRVHLAPSSEDIEDMKRIGLLDG